MDSDEDGQRFRACVVCAVVDKMEELKKGLEYMKFICEVPNPTVDELLTYNDILDHIKKDNNDIDNDIEQRYKFRCITAHQGPLWTSGKDYKGSTYNILVEWETGETTYELLDLIAQDDPVTCADYAKHNNLLDTAGWKRFCFIANSDKKIERMINQAKLQSYRRDPLWKIGVLVPQTHAQAIELDKKNNNTRWQEAEATEMGQLLEYESFVDKGIAGNVPSGHKRIRCHMIYDMKHDGRHKA
jgi:hypothetical protein